MMDVAGAKTRRYVTQQKYPHISQLIASYTIGRLTKDQHLCKSLFPCNDGINRDVEVSSIASETLLLLCFEYFKSIPFMNISIIEILPNI